MRKPRTSQTKRSSTAPVQQSADARSATSSVNGPQEDELTVLVLRACLVARDAVFNVRDWLTGGSRLAFLAIKDCEKELDLIERNIDEQLPGAITRVGEAKARELLACLKFITDLERIGDLAYSAIMQVQSRREKLLSADSRTLVEMASVLCEMLDQVHQGFLTRDLTHAQSVLRADPEVDRMCHALFQRHLAAPIAATTNAGGAKTNALAGHQNFDILLAAQALERIGDHAKNLAEEIYGLAERRSLRHNTRKLNYT